MAAVMVLAALAAAPASAQVQDITCLPNPMFIAQIAGVPHPGPVPEINCPDPVGLPCSQSPVATVTEITQGNSILTNELTITATVPDIPGVYVSSYTSLWIRAEIWNGQNWATLWLEESLEAISQVSSMATSTTFGATGLRKGVVNRFRVAFCRELGTLKGCHCWSEPAYYDPEGDGTANAMPDDFVAFGPAAPALFDIEQILEDQFRRDESSADDAGGDGLGPNAVWRDDLTGTANQPHIDLTTNCSFGGPTKADGCARTPAGMIEFHPAQIQPAPRIFLHRVPIRMIQVV